MTRIRRATAVLAALACTATLGACSPDPAEQDRPGSAASRSAEPDPPGPAERIGVRAGWGPSEAQLDRALGKVRRLPLPKLAGQVIVADYSGTRAPVGLVRSLHLGGVIAFSGNVVSTDQIRSVNRRLAREVRRPWPLLTGVDQEGGIVERVKGEATRFPTFMSAGAAGDTRVTRRAYAGSAGELRGLGFLTGFAPDADVTIGPRDPAIGSRSAGSDPAVVGEQVVAASRGFLDGGVLPVLKHFPGHGSVTSDSHLTLPVQSRSMRQMRRSDLAPFADAVDAGLPAIMVGHLAVPAIQPGMPTSLSRKAITGLLRRDLGFDGLVFTDSLEMQGVTNRFGSAESAVRAVNAGADVVLMPPDPRAARAGLVTAVEQGRLPRKRLVQSATRMVAWLLHQQRTGPQRDRAPGSAARASRALSAAALTITAGPCRGRLVRGAVTPQGDPVAVANFSAAARRAGLEVLVRRSPPDDLATPEPAPAAVARPVRPAEPGPKATKKERQAYTAALAQWRRDKQAYADYQQRRAAWQAREDRRRSALAAWEADEQARLDAGTSIGFSGFESGTVDGEIAVATDTPYSLGRVGAPVRIAAFGNTPGAMSALVEVLLGEARAPGRLPVRMPGLPRQGC
ncbi:hypothetical protein K8W59_13010 [Nocardioides rotundus]|uniref:glycoside hydrolase family 3 protein n=1 Tax=Nocardioides rotundus TaxID=1774216 RepID=UPI001CBF0E8B|nr:glycoside hydrolase family 3 N-terminal domain-containing protein [Nocardioides rotundus]UAL28754.1 hypothetical protein K8W59_13010 [Nocardioides rotundus]